MQLKDGLWFPDSDTHFTRFVFEVGHFIQLLPYVGNRALAIDGGAHVGGWSIEMAKHFNNVVSFEPLKANYECLVKNTEKLDNVETINCALGAIEGKAAMHDPVNPGNSGAGWLVDGEDFDVRPIDSFGFKGVGFIKLDVEGFEPFVIDGAVKTIEESSPVILVEQKPITARYDIPYTAAGLLLEQIGYKEILRMNNDYVYARG